MDYNVSEYIMDYNIIEYIMTSNKSPHMDGSALPLLTREALLPIKNAVGPEYVLGLHELYQCAREMKGILGHDAAL